MTGLCAQFISTALGIPAGQHTCRVDDIGTPR